MTNELNKSNSTIDHESEKINMFDIPLNSTEQQLAAVIIHEDTPAPDRGDRTDPLSIDDSFGTSDLGNGETPGDRAPCNRLHPERGVPANPEKPIGGIKKAKSQHVSKFTIGINPIDMFFVKKELSREMAAQALGYHNVWQYAHHKKEFSQDILTRITSTYDVDLSSEVISHLKHLLKEYKAENKPVRTKANKKQSPNELLNIIK